MGRGLRFLKRYLFKNPRYTVAYLTACVRNGYTYPVHLLSESELVSELSKGRSVIRLGDGEINLMLGLRNHYQSFEPVLQEVLFKIVFNYSSDGPYLLSIPRFVTVSNQELKQMEKFNVWLPLKVMFGLYFKQDLPYLDAHSFYYDGYFERTVSKTLRDKVVILITNQETINVQRANPAFPWQGFMSVVAPSEQSLSSAVQIKSEIEAMLATVTNKDAVLLFAMGPVGKMLAYEFSNKGVQSIDIGKVAEVMHTGESIAYIV